MRLSVHTCFWGEKVRILKIHQELVRSTHSKFTILHYKFTILDSANGIAADPLNKRRCDRCSAAQAFLRAFLPGEFFLIAAIPSFRI